MVFAGILCKECKARGLKSVKFLHVRFVGVQLRVKRSSFKASRTVSLGVFVGAVDRDDKQALSQKFPQVHNVT